MSLQVDVELRDGYVAVHVSGQYSLGSMEQMYLRAADEGRNFGCKRVLIDIRDMMPPVPNWDRYQLGRVVAAAWPRDMRFALIAPQRNINKFFETVAVNRGVQLRVVDSEREALQWLFPNELRAS